MSYEYDMVVIGGRAAGLTAAGMAALLGAKTALIEEHRLGGDCTWVGCVPSKTLLRASKTAHEMKTADRFGFVPVQPEIPFSHVMEHVRRTREHIYKDADAPPNLEKLGVEIILGSARFTDPHSIEIQNRSGKPHRLTARFFVIASGSRPKVLASSAPVLTNESIFELESQPKRLLIIGAGPVGIEMARAFERLGSEVTVVAPGDRILPRDDPRQARKLEDGLAREGVSFIFGQRVAGLDKYGDDLVAMLKNGRTFTCDAALAAIEREPATKSLQLDKAGVRFSERGIDIDAHCRTSQRHIYATGDVTGRYQFTHMGEHMSKIAITNAILRWPKKLDEKHVVWSTFTDPELAHLGESEADLEGRQAKYSTYRFPFKELAQDGPSAAARIPDTVLAARRALCAFEKLDRAVTEAETTGEVKVFTDRSGKILGASILGAHAGEMIAEYALAMRNGLRLSRIADTIHPYPTYMLGNRRAADHFVARQLDSPLLAFLEKILDYSGQRRGSAAL
jgi:pyruvate/2-oxoglutarate dehydrogenase complex dihydrolipoamide dehydrogenase (E3) component